MDGFFWLCHGIALGIYDVLFRGDVAGVEHLPPCGPYVIAANHCSHLDPPLLGSQVPYQVRFFARRSLWKPGFPAWWLTRVGTNGR